MHTSIIAVAILASGLSATALASEVTCESRGKARTECEMNTRGEVKLVRQLSKAPCTEGVSWGLSKHAVWVEQGCRAVFANAGDSAPMATAAPRGLQRFNATCPGNLSVHGDEGGYIFINGNAASVRKYNDSAYDATDAKSGVTVSISKNPDESLSVLYTGRDGANGVCQVD